MMGSAPLLSPPLGGDYDVGNRLLIFATLGGGGVSPINCEGNLELENEIKPSRNRISKTSNRSKTAETVLLKFPLFLLSTLGAKSGVKRLTWGRGNRHLVSIDSRFEIRVWDITRAGSIASLQPRAGTIFADNGAVAISDDAKLVAYASGGNSSFACIFDVAKAGELAKWNCL
jgi:hypothetical protein